MFESELDVLCKELKLETIPHNVFNTNIDIEELTSLLREEVKVKKRRRNARLLGSAKFPNESTIDDFEWDENILLPHPSTKEELISLRFIERKENVICIGAPGTGKTHLSIALGRLACSASINTKFFRVSDLIEKLIKARDEGSLDKFRNRMARMKLIILDEMGYIPFEKHGAELLFQMISEWYENKSLIITSNLEFSQWNRVFQDPKLTSALVDRLVHHAHIINFTGESYRLKTALSANEFIAQ